ncbi:MAG TPA: type II toxin-antitoxin system death-on-curing family toxin [Thermoanaerobaculia bacterium]|nr:type II toxin-antitoxin system death-on-curing family toxin [Thermoanaerobaculia bacterium]
MDLFFLTLDEVLSLHEEQLRLFGGSSGIRQLDLLQSAMGNVEATFGEIFLHETIFEMAAAYLYGICRNHPFVDGNKRTATAAALTFLRMNDIRVHATEDDFYDLVIGVAEARVSKAAVAVFLEKNSA